MDDRIRHPDSGAQHPDGFFVRLQILRSILHWLASLIQLTEDEQDDAGICLGGQHDR